jgi:FixJ family two-component response regulator
MREAALTVNHECSRMTDVERIAYIVDDDDGFRQSLQVLLDSHGFRTFPFRSGNEFLKVVDALDPGCIILDVDMPGMSGLDVFRELRARGADMHVLFVTGSSYGSTRAALDTEPDVRVFEKTDDMTVIITHMQAALKA